MNLAVQTICKHPASTQKNSETKINYFVLCSFFIYINSWKNKITYKCMLAGDLYRESVRGMTNFMKGSDDEFHSQTMLNVSHCFGTISDSALRKASSGVKLCVCLKRQMFMVQTAPQCHTCLYFRNTVL